jgi:HSP20 family protein
MTVLTRWEPFRDIASLQDRMNRLFNEQVANYGSNEESLFAGSFTPAVDVYEDEQAIQLKFEVPGIDEKDIDIRLENQVLTVRGERKLEKETKEENFRRVERRYGSFTRSFNLPNTVDSESVHAAYDKGVLSVRLPKKEAAKPKQIKINVGKTLEASAK